MQTDCYLADIFWQFLEAFREENAATALPPDLRQEFYCHVTLASPPERPRSVFNQFTRPIVKTGISSSRSRLIGEKI
jgi:hypothetical protein